MLDRSRLAGNASPGHSNGHVISLPRAGEQQRLQQARLVDGAAPKIVVRRAAIDRDVPGTWIEADTGHGALAPPNAPDVRRFTHFAHPFPSISSCAAAVLA